MIFGSKKWNNKLWLHKLQLNSIAFYQILTISNFKNFPPNAMKILLCKLSVKEIKVVQCNKITTTVKIALQENGYFATKTTEERIFHQKRLVLF